MTQPKVSIIILNWNGKKYLQKCLDSVFNINYKNYEVLLVDNASTDDSVDFVKKRYQNKIKSKKLKLILNDKNYGYAEGNNRGIKYATGTFILFLNQDTYVDKDFLSILVEYAKKHKNVGICGPKILDYNNPKLIQSIGGELDFFGSPYRIKFGEIDTDHTEKETRPKIVSWIQGSCLLIKKSLLKKLKYCFDPDFFAYFEEIDLCWRASLVGYDVVVIPKAKIYHKGNPNISEKLIFYTSRNKVLSFRKNLSPLLRIIFLPIIFIRGFIALIFWYMKGKLSLKYIFPYFSSLFIKINPDVNLKNIPYSKQLKIFRRPKIKKYLSLFK
ncbi:MAG: glycosyltransferase family 2 protein [Candidatus Pacearchaeota archaeon]